LYEKGREERGEKREEGRKERKERSRKGGETNYYSYPTPSSHSLFP
jgi:hypothetical protein